MTELPGRWKSDGAFWNGTPFVWKRWDKFRPDWTHDHCNFCFACICNHRDRFPETDPGDRGCYRHAWYAEKEPRVYIWVCRTCFKRVRDELGWSVADFPQGEIDRE
ncbi:MAG: hypothetical protein WBW84_09970 [Acidobacteriaceae bacterium]